MKLIIDINENVYTRLFDNGIQDNEIATDDICEMARALRLGKPLTVENLREDIEQLPSVRPQAQTGYWIEKYHEAFNKYYCDKCGFGSELKTNYCPDCGTCMKGGE